MKVTIELDEKADAIDALNGTEWRIAMFELDQELRGMVKHGFEKAKELNDCEIDTYHKCRELLRNFMNEYNLTFDV
jgi:hypothetical protein